ncbi:MAG: AgmX/PglI C-terminal domain-containing protein [Deltaproteobacteria bacterium]|nr:AgmX/PglI C-terminal domain-containing protein [Deltaproteobacteria bacterium]
MFRARRDSRWYLAAGLAALVGLTLLWAGGTGRDAGSMAPGVRAALVGPGAADPDLVVEWVVLGRLPAAASAAGPVTVVEAAETAAPSAGGPEEATPAEPLVGSIGSHTAPPASRPDHADVPEGRLREGRTPALREGEPAAGWISDRTLRSILGRKQRSLEACYHGARAADPTLEGAVTFALTVRQAGDVEVEVLDRSPALEQAGVTGCIRQRLESLDFRATPPQGGELHLRLPMSFLRVPEPVVDSDA